MLCEFYRATPPVSASLSKKGADLWLVREGEKGNTGVSTLLSYVAPTRGLIEVAHHLMRHEPRWKKLADRLKQRGKPYNKIVAAVGNRWIRALYYEMKEPVAA